MGSEVISERTLSQVQETASTESRTGIMIEGNCGGVGERKEIISHATDAGLQMQVVCKAYSRYVENIGAGL